MKEKPSIDCLFIGHNEMNFPEYEKNVRTMGMGSGAYRDLDLNFIRDNGQPESRLYTASEFINRYQDKLSKPFSTGSTFNAAIAYLGTWLQARDFSFDFVNSFQDEKEELAKKLSTDNILIIAIVTTLYVSLFPILEIMEFIKKYNTRARVIIGGPFITTKVRSMDHLSLQCLLKTIDADIYVNSSQGEATLTAILHQLKNKQTLEQVANIYYKDETGNTYRYTRTAREDNPLCDNMVNWDLFNGRVGKYVNVRTSISCPFSCSFCGFPQHAGSYQTAPTESVEKELNRLKGIQSVGNVNFIDDTFNVPVNRFKDLMRMIIKNNYPFRWIANFRCQFADGETVSLMKEAGCAGVFLGIESGSDQVLQNMNKTASVAAYRKGIDLLKKEGILTFGSFVVGFPGETDETFRDTVTFIRESEIDFFRTQLWYCEPITPIWQQREKYNIKGSQFEWSHRTMTASRALDLIESVFPAIGKSTWLPQYNFDLHALLYLWNGGLPQEEVKTLIIDFNKRVKEKLPGVSNSPADRQLKDVGTENRDIVEKYGASFDF